MTRPSCWRPCFYENKVMSKRIFALILSIAAVFAACTKPSPVVPDDTDATEFSINKKVMMFVANSPEPMKLELSANKEWTATSSSEWIHLSAASGNGAATLYVSVDDNIAPTGEAASGRRGRVEFSCSEINVNLDISQMAEDIVFVVGKDSETVPETGATVVIPVENNIPFQVEIPSAATWITQVASKALAKSNVTLSIAPNTADESRQAEVKIIPETGDTRLVTITQTGNMMLELSVSSLSFEAADPKDAVVSLSCSGAWTMEKDVDWISVTPSSGSGNAELSVRLSTSESVEGQSAEARTADVRFISGSKTVVLKVGQSAETLIFVTDKAEASVPAAGAGVVLAVDHNAPVNVEVPATASWISYVATKAVVSSDVILRVEANTGSAREASVKISIAGGESRNVRISQMAYDSSYAVTFAGDGSSTSPYLISNAEEFMAFRDRVNAAETAAAYADKYYKLTDDIDLSCDLNYIPVGSSEACPFKGSFDGDGKIIKGLRINNTAKVASGLFGYLSAATVRNFRIENAKVDSGYALSGVIAGMADSATIQDIIVNAVFRAYGKEISISAADYAPVTTNNSGYAGGIVGLARTSTVKGCHFSGNMTAYGKFCGGIVGTTYNSLIEDCSVAAGTPVHIYYHYTGGIAGRALGKDNELKRCTFEGILASTGYSNGGIVGQLLGGKVTSCALGSKGSVNGDKYFVGGIVGQASPLEDIHISKCASYGYVKGGYSVAGICGYGGPGSGSDKDLNFGTAVHGHILDISACAAVAGTITATWGNSSNYPIAAGIIGWTHGSSSAAINYHLNACYSLPGIIQTTYGANVNGVLSGISSYQNNPGNSVIENCYSAYRLSDLLICNAAPTSSNLWYAGVAIRCTQPTTVKNCYSESSLRTVYTSSGATESGNGQYSVSDMTNGTLLAQLNATANGVTWVVGLNGYPTIEGIPVDPDVKVSARKRVSVIGDSISTFKGIIPGNYSAHYPATDGTLTLPSETYWWRLIYDHMKDAELDVNIAFSGSTVTNTTAENYSKRYGTASNAWWHNSYSERFAACGGCGHPDIILIHGGTNDWSHNADPLAPGVAIRNESGNIYGGSAPSEAIMNSMYAVADAARTRAEVNALPDGTFCEAYIKLLCQIRERYPQCKVVCIIGDYLSQSIEQSVLQIAEHYGAKTVNLFRVNGFNDLGGYEEGKLPGLGKPQPNMPKHDHTDLNSTGGCHPGSKCMDFMATKIYNELGAWLEE